MTEENKHFYANELVTRFNLSLYQIKHYAIPLWEKQFYAKELKISLNDLIDILDYIIAGNYKR